MWQPVAVLIYSDFNRREIINWQLYFFNNNILGHFLKGDSDPGFVVIFDWAIHKRLRLTRSGRNEREN